MPSGTRELRVKLTADVARFKKEIAAAEKRISDLKTTMIKAGGGSKKMRTDLKVLQTQLKSLKASAASAKSELQAVGGSLGKGALTKNTRLLNQTAYALDDVQYGFRGVQNNLQQIAVQAGWHGGVVLGITAISIAVNYAIEHWEELGFKTKSVLSDITKELAKSQGPIAQTRLYAEVLKTADEGTDAHKYALKQLKEDGYDPAKRSLDEFIKLQEKQILLNAVEAASGDKIAEYLGHIITARQDIKEIGERDYADIVYGTSGQLNVGSGEKIQQAEIARKLKAIQKFEDKIKETLNISAAEVKKLFGEGGLFAFLLEGDDDAANNAKNKYKSVASAIRSYFQEARNVAKGLAKDLKDSLKEIETFSSKFQDVIKKYSLDGRSKEDNEFFQAKGILDEALRRDWINLNQYKDLIAKLKESFKEVEDEAGNLSNALQSALQQAFVGLGQSIGEALKGEFDGGERFLGILAGFMETFGAALIALGLAKVTLEANGPGGVLIAAGVGLIAAATLLKPGGAGHYGSGGSSTGIKSNIQATPVSAQGSGNSSQVILRGDHVRYLQQQQDDTYRGRN